MREQCLDCEVYVEELEVEGLCYDCAAKSVGLPGALILMRLNKPEGEYRTCRTCSGFIEEEMTGDVCERCLNTIMELLWTVQGRIVCEK